MTDNKNKDSEVLPEELRAKTDVSIAVPDTEDSGLGEAEEITNWSEEVEAEPEDAESSDDAKSQKKGKKESPKQREKKKRDGSQKKEKPEVKEPSALAEYISGIKQEMRRTTWPTKPEVLKWSLIVMAVIAFFALLIFLVDNFVATPVMYFISGLYVESDFGVSSIVLTVLFFASGLGTAAGVMLHSGGDSNGLSDTLSTQLTGGSAVAEKNLDRLTIAMALLFVLTLVLMMVFFPQGSISLGA